MKPGLVLLGLVAVLSCSPATEPQPAARRAPPAEFGAPVYDLSRNPVTPAGFELGKTLFYDARLSRDGTISCGECHRQDFGFTHHGHDLSHGIDDRVGTRNAQPLQNLAWQTQFFWDGGVHDLDLVPVVPLENPVEMDAKLGTVLERLRQTPEYPARFKAAFGTEEITTARFLQALSQFMNALVSADSKYDRYRKGTETFTAEEEAGLKLFEQKGCASCHAGSLFTDGSFRNNGLGPGLHDDLGRATVTEQAADRYRFKVPSLRNVEATRPYFHDGRVADLETVLDHYRSRVQDSPTLDPLLKRDGRTGIAISDAEKRQLVAFLKTLTDQTFLTNPRFAPPKH
jgi:cytochrome c peroxidase